MTRQILLIAVISMVLWPAMAQAAAQSPMDFIKAKEKSMEPLLKNTAANQKKIVNIITSMMDFDSICQQSLGKHWVGRSDAEKDDFKKTLRGVIEKNLIARLKDNSKRKPEYKSEKITGNTAVVMTLVQTSDDPRAEKTEVEYKLERRGNTWITVDMVTDGVSLVANYRSQFNKIITEQGWDALVKKLKDRLAQEGKAEQGKL
jgi:phospholipid transport system substrate-binding protein